MRVKQSLALRIPQDIPLNSIAKRGLLVLLVLAVSAWLLHGQTQGLDPAHVGEAIARISWGSLAAAVLFSALSLWAVSAYDRQGFRALRWSQPKTALRTGYTATAISQTLGFGLLIGSLVRWRCYAGEGLSMPQAAALTGVISAGFMGCLAVLLGLSTLIQPIPNVDIPTALILGFTFALVALSLLQIRVPLGKFSFSLPTLPIVSRFMGLTVLDIGFASAALWILLPAEIRPDYAVFTQVFLLCLGFALISGAPGGLGVFEVTCLMLLKDVPQADLLSAILVFRAIYYGLPFLIAAALLMETERTRSDPITSFTSERQSRDPKQVPAWLVVTSPQAEAALAYLGDKEFLFGPHKQGALMYARSGSSLVAMGNPLGPNGAEAEALLCKLSRKAKSEGLRPVVYRADEAQKERATRLGWKALQQGQEAVIDPQSFEVSGKKFRELKRKLKQAKGAGVKVVHYRPGTAPMQHLQHVANEWKARHGDVELGFSQGRFDPAYLSRHHVFAAMVGDEMVGFISLWNTGDKNELSLDLMRNLDTAPMGTQHLLLHDAIQMAKIIGARRFSLCSVQLHGLQDERSAMGRIGHWAYENLNDRHHLQGLARFKTAFRPDWEPRFLLTQGHLPPLKAIWDIYRLLRA